MDVFPEGIVLVALSTLRDIGIKKDRFWRSAYYRLLEKGSDTLRRIVNKTPLVVNRVSIAYYFFSKIFLTSGSVMNLLYPVAIISFTALGRSIGTAFVPLILSPKYSLFNKIFDVLTSINL